MHCYVVLSNYFVSSLLGHTPDFLKLFLSMMSMYVCVCVCVCVCVRACARMRVCHAITITTSILISYTLSIFVDAWVWPHTICLMNTYQSRLRLQCISCSFHKEKHIIGANLSKPHTSEKFCWVKYVQQKNG